MAALAAASAPMPTKQELRLARGVVQDRVAEHLKAIDARETAPGDVAAILLSLAKTAKNHAEKYLLMQGAFKLHTRGGDLSSAADVVADMKREFEGMPAEVVLELMEGESRPGTGEPTEWTSIITKARFIVERTKEMAVAIKGKNDFRFDLGGASIDFVMCPPGTFKMGRPGCTDKLNPDYAHNVTLTRPFWMSRHPVTVEQWTAAMGPLKLSPAQKAVGPKMALNRNWHDIHRLADTLQTAMERALPPGYVVRLPTEAEWQYAAHANSKDKADPHRRLMIEFTNTMRLPEYRTTADELVEELKLKGFEFEYNDTQKARIARTGKLELPFEGRIFPRMGEHRPNAWGLHDFMQCVGYEVVLDTVRAEPDNHCFFRKSRKDYFFADEETDPLKSAGPPKATKVDVLMMVYPKTHSKSTHQKMIFRLVVGPELVASG